MSVLRSMLGSAAMLILSLGVASSVGAHSKAAPAIERAIWRQGHASIWLVPCPSKDDFAPDAVAVEARRGQEKVVSKACYGARLIDLLWSHQPGTIGPDAIVLANWGGSAGGVTVMSFTFGAKPAVDTVDFDRGDETSVYVHHHRPVFEAKMDFGMNGASNAAMRSVSVPVIADRRGFHVEIPMMVAPPLTRREEGRVRAIIRSDLKAWRANEHFAGAATSVTIEALIGLIVSGHADTAHRLLIAAGRDALGPRFDPEAYWDDLCLEAVEQRLWKRFDLDRLPHADLIRRSAQLGQRDRSGPYLRS